MLIDKKQSQLESFKFNDKQILEDSAKYIQDKLDLNPKIILYGKEATMHRSVGFFSNESLGYRYSGQISKSKELGEPLSKLLNVVNKYFNTEYNGILVNLYADGSDYIGAHSDDEEALDKNNKSVISISYGATRKFRIREKNISGFTDFDHHHGEVLKMSGEFQTYFTHEIPQQKRITESRISFTFRKHLD